MGCAETWPGCADGTTVTPIPAATRARAVDSSVTSMAMVGVTPASWNSWSIT